MLKATVDFTAHYGKTDIVCKAGETIEGGKALVQWLKAVGVAAEAKAKEGKNER